MEEATSKPVKGSKSNDLNLSWRDARYHRFYEVVDQLVDELQEHVWAKSGKAKRRLKGDGLEKLHYSLECLVRDCMAVVLQRKRKSEAAIRKGQYYYSSERPDQMLTYSIHIERAFEGQRGSSISLLKSPNWIYRLKPGISIGISGTVRRNSPFYWEPYL